MHRTARRLAGPLASLLAGLLSLTAATAATAAVAPAPAGAVAPSAAARAAGATAYTTTPLWFRVAVVDDAGAPTTCTVDAQLYLPRTASAARPVPAVLGSNGFGGSKEDLFALGAYLAGQGYAFLTYSGLGFGGSSCPISLDAPEIDGVAASQLVSYLGGATGRAYLDADLTRPAPALRVVRRDARDHSTADGGRGRRVAHDPRVGMVGGSYGGGNQLAAAIVDKRIDALVPIITWNDLSYSLAPNNADLAYGVTTRTPGVAKIFWAAGFSAVGVAGGLTGVRTDPERVVGCPDFQPWVCPSLVTAAATGTVDDATFRRLHDRSVAAHLDEVRVPTLLAQGQGDTLFNLNEAVATYTALRAREVPVKMLWLHGGHSEPFLPGELQIGAPSARTQYATGRVLAWFEHYLKDRDISTGPAFAYYRDWVPFTGNAAPAYASARAYPLPGSRTFRLSGGGPGAPGGLTTGAPVAGSQAFTTPPAGLPTSSDPLDVVGGSVPVEEADLPGTAVSWQTPVLTRPLDVAGVPQLDLRLATPPVAVGTSQPATDLVLFAKILDVAPDGTAMVVRNLVAPVRVADTTAPVRVRLPGLVHRFAVGHRLRLVVAGGSSNYRAGLLPTPVTVATGPDLAGQTLRLPLAD